ncbi:UNVERIFIED_CONTAM: hypothetical protein PYX00_008116 [Menopon gallinae]|uniref:Secreted protein n=1 Tax=Menopon gallinae TaxID=328185 RepID=A0AAW2HMZ0_9NEOP
MNRLHFFVFSIKLIFALAESPALLLSTAIRINKVIVSYPSGVISERDLNVCELRSACNIIHKRFWLPPMVERLCRCPHRNECPWTWSDADNQTVYLNNRSQMKFCSPVSDLPVCTQKKSAITVSTLRTATDDAKPTKNHTELQNGDRSRRHNEHRNITISCNCQEPHYWKLKSNATKPGRRYNSTDVLLLEAEKVREVGLLRLRPGGHPLDLL